MNTLAIAQDLSGTGWRKRTAGSGVVTIASGVASCVGVGDGAALLEYYIPVVPGMRVEVDVFATKVSGDATIALDKINHNSGSWTQADSVLVDGTDCQRYHLSAVVPLKSSAEQFLRLTMGIGSVVAGEARFFGPVIRTSGGLGSPLAIAAGYVRVESGGASLHPHVPSFGIASVARSDANTVTVTLNHQMPSVPENVRPRIFLTGTAENEEIPLVGNFFSAVGATPSFTIKWSSGAAFADVSTGNWYAFVQVMV